MPFDTVKQWQHFHIEPFVELEDIFINKAVRTLQLKLRECIVYPPAERLSTRRSVCFPERVCSSSAAPEEAATAAPAPAPEEARRGTKRPAPEVAEAGEEAEDPEV